MRMKAIGCSSKSPGLAHLKIGGAARIALAGTAACWSSQPQEASEHGLMESLLHADRDFGEFADTALISALHGLLSKTSGDSLRGKQGVVGENRDGRKAVGKGAFETDLSQIEVGKRGLLPIQPSP